MRNRIACYVLATTLVVTVIIILMLFDDYQSAVNALVIGHAIGNVYKELR